MFAVQFEVEKLMEVRNGLLFTKQQNWKQRDQYKVFTIYTRKSEVADDLPVLAFLYGSFYYSA